MSQSWMVLLKSRTSDSVVVPMVTTAFNFSGVRIYVGCIALIASHTDRQRGSLQTAIRIISRGASHRYIGKTSDLKGA